MFFFYFVVSVILLCVLVYGVLRCGCFSGGLLSLFWGG